MNSVTKTSWGIFVIAGMLVLGFSVRAEAATSCAANSSVVYSTTQTHVDAGATVATYQSPLWQPAWTGAEWIWNSFYVANPSVTETREFSENVQIAGSVSSASIEIYADDYYRLYVNGVERAAEFGDGNFLPLNGHVHDIAPFLVNGSNQISIAVTNVAHNEAVHGTVGTPQNNPAGVLFRINFEENICVQSATTPVTGGGNGPIAGSIDVPSVHTSGSSNSDTSYTPVSSGSFPEIVGIESYGSLALAEDVKSATVKGDSNVNVSARENPEPSQTLALLALAGSEESGFDVSCVLWGVVLAALIWLMWKFVLAEFTHKYTVQSRKNIELLFYGSCTIVVISLLTYTGYACPLVYFLVAMIAVMLVRLLQKN